MRVLGAVRKSVVPRDKRRREQDPLAYSLHRQRDKLTSALVDHQFVGFAEDEDVGGAVSAFLRPKLGPWFARMDDWDALAVARFDRISRSVRDFSELCDWLMKHGKILICLDPPIDLSTPGGRAFAQMLAVFAEYERELIRERVRDSWHDLRDTGRWPGGTVPFGYSPVPADPDGWRLAPDPELAPIVAEMARRYLAGHSLHMLARWLNAEGYPPSRDAQRLRAGKPVKGKGWTPATVKTVLSSPTLAGFVLAGGEPRRDSDGLIIRIDPLIPMEDYERLQAALRDRRNSGRVNASRLLQVAYCALCSSPLYITVTETAGLEFRYYICQGARRGQCRAVRVPADYLEELAERLFLALVGQQEILERIYVPGTDHAVELAVVEEAITNLEDQYVSGTVYQGQDGGERFARMMRRLEERRDHLAVLESVPPRYDYRSTERTFADRWEEEDDAGRRMLAVGAGFQIRISRTPIDPADIAAEARRQFGITATARQLGSKAANAKWMMGKSTDPVRLAELQSKLAAIETQRRHLRGLRRHNEVIAFQLDPELAKRAGLAAAGLPVELPDHATLEEALAPLCQAMGRPTG